MSFTELFLIAIGLSMDAFAVAVCKGLKMPKMRWGQMIIIGLFFGVAQAVMPAIGWILGKQFEMYIVNIDHWIAFVLLAFIGGKMLKEAFDKDGDCCKEKYRFDFKELFVLAVATSIDALAVGITFAFLKVNLLASVSLIGVTTFILSSAGVFIGHKFGAKYKSKAEAAGGIILILMGAKILLEHLGIISF